MLTVSQLRLSLNGNIILQNLSFLVDEGQIVQLSGPNGSGKTSLLRCIIGINKNVEGDILIDSIPVSQQTVKKYAPLISFLIDRDFSYSYLSVKDNLEIFKYYNGVENISEDLQQLFDDFGLTPFLEKSVKRLSAGYTQKLEIILALLNEGKYVFLDEPGNNLDKRSVELLYDYVQKKAAKNGCSYIIVSHNDEYLAGIAHQQIALEIVL